MTKHQRKPDVRDIQKPRGPWALCPPTGRILGDSNMAQVRATDPGGARQAACPAGLRRRIRSNLVRASLNRMDKPRAKQALCLLVDLGTRVDVALVQEPRSSDSAPNTREAQAVPRAAARPAQEVSGGRRKGSVGPVASGGEDHPDSNPLGRLPGQSPRRPSGMAPPAGPAGSANQDQQRKGNRHELE